MTTMTMDHAATGIRELTVEEMEWIGGGSLVSDALDFGRAAFDAAPPEAQFLFLVAVGAAVGAATGGIPGAIAGGILGGVSFLAT